MSKKIIQPPKDLQNPYIKSFEEYEVMYRESIEKPKEFDVFGRPVGFL